MNTAGGTLFFLTLGAIAAAYLIKTKEVKIRNEKEFILIMEEEEGLYENDPSEQLSEYDQFAWRQLPEAVMQSTFTGKVKRQ